MIQAETGRMFPQARDTWSPSSWTMKEGASPEPVEGARPCDTWISASDLQTVRESISLISSPQFVGLCSGSPGKWGFRTLPQASLPAL